MKDTSIRDFCIKLNTHFAEWEQDTGILMSHINVGKQPNDCTGDLIPIAMRKLEGNAQAVAQHIAKAVEPIDELYEEFRRECGWGPRCPNCGLTLYGPNAERHELCDG